jgi:ABC-type uncharacterized transport system permease subunit
MELFHPIVVKKCCFLLGALEDVENKLFHLNSVGLCGRVVGTGLVHAGNLLFGHVMHKRVFLVAAESDE